MGIEAAGAIGVALEQHPELRRAHWKDMFTGRMKTEIPPALVNLTRYTCTFITGLLSPCICVFLTPYFQGPADCPDQASRAGPV